MKAIQSILNPVETNISFDVPKKESNIVTIEINYHEYRASILVSKEELKKLVAEL